MGLDMVLNCSHAYVFSYACVGVCMCVALRMLWAALIFRLSGTCGSLGRVVSSPLPQTNAFAISPFRGEGGQTRGRRGNMFREQRVNGA